MWIFGYGSLVWKADFPYIKKVVGYVKGYERKFWQASIDHRGVPEKPGRVVTLVTSTDPDIRVWGIAYKIHRRDVELVVRHLDMREVMGYEKVPAEFHPIPHHAMNLFDYEPYTKSDNGISISLSNSDVSSQFDSGSLLIENEDSIVQASYGHGSDSGRSSITSDDAGNKSESDADSDTTSDDDEYDSNYENVKGGRPFTVTMYFGSETNEHYVGPASLHEMAVQIFECTGTSGRNRDYLFNLAESMRQICDEALDSHLSELEREVRLLEWSETAEKRAIAL